MLRFGLRLLGFLTLVSGFAALVVDGTRSIAGNALDLTPLGRTLMWMAPNRFPALEPALQHIHPILWDPVALTVLRIPTWIFLFCVGFLLLRLGRKPERKIGFTSRP
ncbi:hypothetical protein [Methylovirgula sp. 4M-Z18]|uniref:hypothetical protein n=1 Tax=Methylovirgula sp. 4M-Z18 TaxID=2293567 RepID=UPI000E2F7738|nr:hypothetical protein [Methylovirgula sp. 4M-Z18]RFB75545.1 hypothetical protein DYH55_22035 [Methylovirgula sp. 4M-Z18]